MKDTASTDPSPAPGEDAGLAPGTRLGKYEVVRRLGVGGMGAVYEALHTGIGRPMALKTLSSRLASEPRSQTRFLREAAAASRLDHPHVVTVTDFGAEGGVSYLVMELLRGEDLAALLSRDRLSSDRAADLLLPVCAGVFAAHAAGIVHRDLKPPNIFLAQTPIGEVVPKVLDFGISRWLDDEDSQSLTATGALIGTTPYLSPEQIAGKPADARSDQYTLGVIVYECVVGRRPHEGEGVYAIMRSIAEGRFPPPRQQRPELAPELEAVILRAMHLDPTERFESVHALGRALLAFASARGQARWGDYFGAPAGKPALMLARTPTPTPTTQELPLPDGDRLPPTRTKGRPLPAAEPETTETVAPASARGKVIALAVVAVLAVALILLLTGRHEQAPPVPEPAPVVKPDPIPVPAPAPPVEEPKAVAPAPPPAIEEPPPRPTRSKRRAPKPASVRPRAPILD